MSDLIADRASSAEEMGAAIRAKDYAAMRRLHDEGCDVIAVAPNMDFPLWVAAENGDVEAIRLLFEFDSECDEFASCALLRAGEANHADAVRVLIEFGADARHEDSLALRAASKAGFADVVRELLSGGADPNAAGGEPLGYASSWGRADVVEELLKGGASVDEGGGMALRWAARNGHAGIVAKLIGFGSDLKAYGAAAAYRAAKEGHRKALEELLSPGADMGVGSELMTAALADGHADIASALLSAGWRFKEHENDLAKLAARDESSELAAILTDRCGMASNEVERHGMSDSVKRYFEMRNVRERLEETAFHCGKGTKSIRGKV